MKQGICSLSLLPLRSEPSSKSEMVSQLLFGEVFTILEEKEEWVFIENHSDNYRGWLNFLQVDLISEKPNESKVLNTFPFISAINLQSKEPLLLPTASYLHDFKMVENQTCFKQNGIQYLVQTESLIDSFETINNVLDLAIKFLNVPYLWGGKSAFGIDCSGFTQVVFKTIGFQLPRDAWQQATIGESKTFIEEISPGDLLFFGDQPEKITHVGIALGGNKIIHASGKVRIDAFDSYGIFNIESKKHTHVLRNIRSISQKH